MKEGFAASVTLYERINAIIRISLYHNVLCRFGDGQYRLGRIEYNFTPDGMPVPIYSPGATGDVRYVGKPIIAYEDLVRDNIKDGWHGDYTDGQEPKRHEECIILMQELRSYGEQFRTEYAVYDGKGGFFGFKNTPTRSVIGFKHISPNNGMPY